MMSANSLAAVDSEEVVFGMKVQEIAGHSFSWRGEIHTERVKPRVCRHFSSAKTGE